MYTVSYNRDEINVRGVSKSIYNGIGGKKKGRN